MGPRSTRCKCIVACSNYVTRRVLSGISIGSHIQILTHEGFIRGAEVNMERGGNMERSISQKLKAISGVSL